MEQQAIDEYDRAARDAVFAAINIPFSAVTDLEGFENFVYGFEDRVIRVTHESHRSFEQLLGELEFLTYLGSEDAAVARPIALADGNLVLKVGAFQVCMFERASGTNARHEKFTAAVIKEWGRCIGRFHKLARSFLPARFREILESMPALMLSSILMEAGFNREM